MLKKKKDSIPEKSQEHFAFEGNVKFPSKKLPLEGEKPADNPEHFAFQDIKSRNRVTAIKITQTPRPERGKREDFEECSYIRGAPGVMYGSGEENPPLPVDQHGLLVVGHRAFDGGRQRCQQHRAAQQGSRPAPPHHSLPAPRRWSKRKTTRTKWVRVRETAVSPHTGLPLRLQHLGRPPLPHPSFC